MAETVPEGNTVHREIRVDRTLCMGSGQCSWYAPNTFDQDDETIAIVIDPQGDPEDAIKNAVDSCPTQALSFVAAADGTADSRE